MPKDQRTDLVPARQALALLLEGAGPAGSETVLLAQASGRVLSTDLVALRTQPPFAASAMDGYALRASDIAHTPATLRIIGEAAAGHPFLGEVKPGEAVRISTGAPVPQGADTVVMQENAQAGGGHVVFAKPTPQGHSVRPKGLDFTEGQTLLKRGDILDPQRLSLAASMNHASLAVWRKPHIALAATGDELCLPGSTPAEGQIIASNTFGLAAIIAEAGGMVSDLGIIADRASALDQAFAKALQAGADVIMTTGGASVGDHDLVKPAFERLGASFAFTRIAMRPGKPLIAGSFRFAGRQVRCIGLAGNPVSSLIAAQVFVRPLIGALAGYPRQLNDPVSAVLGCDLPANGDREDHMRARAKRLADGTLQITPFSTQDSSMLALLAKADAILIRSPFEPAQSAGARCAAIMMRSIEA